MGLDYGYTCSQIDSDIKDFKGTIKGFFEDMLFDVCPLYLETEEGKKMVEAYTNSAYEDCQGIFENVRSCNEDMRQAADKQIDDAEEKVADLESEIDDKQTQIESLEYDLNVSEDRCAELEHTVSILEREK